MSVCRNCDGHVECEQCDAPPTCDVERTADADFAADHRFAPPTDTEHVEPDENTLYPCQCSRCRYGMRWMQRAISAGLVTWKPRAT